MGKQENGDQKDRNLYTLLKISTSILPLSQLSVSFKTVCTCSYMAYSCSDYACQVMLSHVHKRCVIHIQSRAPHPSIKKEKRGLVTACAASCIGGMQ